MFVDTAAYDEGYTPTEPEDIVRPS